MCKSHLYCSIVVLASPWDVWKATEKPKHVSWQLFTSSEPCEKCMWKAPWNSWFCWKNKTRKMLHDTKKKNVLLGFFKDNNQCWWRGQGKQFQRGRIPFLLFGDFFPPSLSFFFKCMRQQQWQIHLLVFHLSVQRGSNLKVARFCGRSDCLLHLSNASFS